MGGGKITYLLGAGASYQACPILSELGEKMETMSSQILDKKYNAEYNINIYTRDNFENLAQIIGYFGRKAKEYGTIDTYAKKLSLNSDLEFELKLLKLAISSFFIVWELTNDSIKTRDFRKYVDIDLRYISLLATYLEKSDEDLPMLNRRIKFISWNYDLQLEKAFKSFISEKYNPSFSNLTKLFSYNFSLNRIKNWDVDLLHLNGLCGFYDSSDPIPKSLLNRCESKQMIDILEKIKFTYDSVSSSNISFDNHINYAWEQTELAKQKREYAKKIFTESDVIVIIGYSFPPFNRQVDQMLFDELKGRETKVYYQDPNASEDLIRNFINTNMCEIIAIKDRLDQFFVPYEF